MAKRGDTSLVNEVLEPFRRIFNTISPKDKSAAGPSKLILSNSDRSIEDVFPETSAIKRKLSLGSPDLLTPEKRPRRDSSSSITAPPSPWEAKKTKIDLIAARAQIIKLEARVNHQHLIRKEMQILFEEEKASLVEQHKRDEKSVSDMEDRLNILRKRMQELREDHHESLKSHQDQKTKWDNTKADLQKQIADLKDELLEANVSSKNQISEMKKDMDELLQALEGAQSEVEILKNELAKQTSRAEQCTTLTAQVDKQAFELQQVTNKLKELEYERDSYKDWHQQAKTAQKRLSNMAELEKEVVRLRAAERTLREAVCNKLILEEQVYQLTTRVEALQPAQQELHEAKVKIAALETLLEDWKNTAQAYGVESAKALSSSLESALSNQLTAVSRCSEAESKITQLSEEMATLKFERDKATSKLSEVLTVRKNQESLIHRLQKRLLLVTRERDSYRQQLDCYEKELTVTLCGESGAGSAALLSARVEQLEKSLQGYRDLLATHDQEGQTKVMETLRAEASKWREDAESLRCEVQKVRAQRDQLQTHIDRLVHSGTATKVLHLADNPAAAAQKQMKFEMESAQEEIKRLKGALRDGGAAVCPEETQQLKQQLENSRIKLKRMKEEFTSSAQEYRDVVYMLLGYKIDRTGHKNYRISNMYAESAEEYLTFTLCDDGIEMVHTDYSTSLGELVELHLHHHRSIPVFLSALTMELFTRTTMQHEVL